MRSRIVHCFRLWRLESRRTLGLALPIVAGMVAQMLMGLTDTIMVGRVGVIPLAASSLVNIVGHIPLVLGMGLLSSIAITASHAFGARQWLAVSDVLRHGLVLAAVLGFVCAAGLMAFRPVLAVLGQPAEVVQAAQNYFLLYAASLAPALLAHGGKQFSEAVKHPWMPGGILLGGVLLNVWLNWLFIYGHWGVPAMGLDGAGWATLAARLTMAFAMTTYILTAPALRAFQPKRWFARFHPRRFRELLHLGWPIALQHLLEVGAFASAGLMMGWINAESIAAHQIAITCAATTFMFALGTGMAVSIRVGHSWGAAQFSRIRRIAFGGTLVGAGIMAAFGLSFVLCGELIASWFVESPTVLRLAASLLIVAAFFQVADGIQVVSLSALRGLGDVRTPAAIAGLAYWIIALPVGGWLAFKGNLGAVGIWIGLAIGLGTAAVLLMARFIRMTRWNAGTLKLMKSAGHRHASSVH
jgi:MATE family multidrug resistance protein